MTAGYLSPATDRADVVIVGGGVIGCACAHELARQGASVVLIELEPAVVGADGHQPAAGEHGHALAPGLDLDPAGPPQAVQPPLAAHLACWEAI